MELSDYIRLIRKRWISILAVALLGLAVAGAYTAFQTPKYDAKTQLFVSVKSTDSPTDLIQGSSFSEKRVTSYVNLATSPRVLQPVIDKLHLDLTAEGLKSQVTASAPPQTVLIDIKVTNTTPKLAAAIANSTADSLTQAVQQVEEGSVVKLSTIEPATEPISPSSPKVPLNLALGLVVGLLLGLSVAVLRQVLDTRVRTVEDIERITTAAVLGRFAAEDGIAAAPLVTQQDPYSPRAESFRQLRTHLQFTNISGGSQSIVVTSTIPGEGKSTTAVNLAIMLAESGSKVLLVDADLRRPRIANMLGLESSVGLTTVLSGRVTAEDALQTWGAEESLHVLTSGRTPPNPSELLGSPNMHALIRQMEQQYDVIIIDSPPLLPVTDPAVLGAAVSGILLVISTDGHVHKEQLSQAISNINAVDAKLLGLALNREEIKHGTYSYYDYRPDHVVSSKKQVTRKSSDRDLASSLRRGN
ncbi:polysaccharide biosynthesis tyrosine autokinase [Arthrobacter sp. H14-L1]|uniref:polysaccharide biosynthesis tyrosine autokinase n=1 Tax=Arthrobacter sp. H14-L1 TaxID=2996697 RepID=UPI0022704642|nr:polysaccharide biosynthesis tyrosine autokinase [Arthrobacter sp. H14-L1]MCY0905475.1 polysaccharide biosynthesis tyrosine autokinase [Arthrobacter sp. H14-L1]